MRRIGFLFLILIVLLIDTSCFSQKKEKADKDNKRIVINVEIKGWENKDVILGSHYLNKNFFLDTIKTNNKGIGTFKIDSMLPTGTYFIVFPKKTFIEFIIDQNNYNFSITGDINDFMNTVKIKGSPENSLFVDYQIYSYRNRNKMISFSKRLQANRSNEDSIKVINKEIEEFNAYMNKKRDEYIDKAKGTFLAKLLYSLKEVVVPDTFLVDESLPSEQKDSAIRMKKYLFYKNHFFDYVDFSDPRFLYTTVYVNKLNKYFTQVAYNNSDSIANDALKILKMAEKNKTTLDALARLLINNFESSGRWANEKAFIVVAENYFLNGKVKTSEGFKQRLLFKVNTMKKLLVGEKIPVVPLVDLETKQTFDFSKIEAPLMILYFWSAGCDHCKEITPKIYKLYEKYRNKGLKVISITATNDFDDWKEYIKQNNLTSWTNAIYAGKNYGELIMIYDIFMTPRLYVLDKDKRIIAKDLSEHSLEMLLEERLGK